MVSEVKPQCHQMWLNMIAVIEDLDAVLPGSALWPTELCIKYCSFQPGVQARTLEATLQMFY